MSIKMKNGSQLGLKMKIVTLATAVAITGGAVFAPVAAVADQMTIEQLQAQIVALQAQLTALLAASGGSTAMSMSKCTFTRSLYNGVSGDDVKCLQQYLNSAGHQVASSGVGSPGSETQYYGGLTTAAVAKWQAANGVSPAVGYFGPISRAKYDSVVVSTGGTTTGGTTTGGTTTTTGGTTTGGTTPTSMGSGLTISAPSSQPAAQLAPANAARLPVTDLNLTASTDGDVTVKSITVERQGLSADAAVSGVVLLDENGVQIGVAKTLNALHQAILNESFVVKAGTTKKVTVALNMGSSLGSYSGQVVKMTVVAVDAGSASVYGSLPVTGNGMTVNSTLTIGSVTMQRGSVDPGSSVTKPVGTLGYTFSAIRVTAGSAEKVYLKSVRWNQTGSIGSGDLKNLKTYIDGTAYDTVLSSDGKYYTAYFGSNGLLIDKGFSKEVSVKGDIEGGSGRTIDFDVAKKTDVNLVGELYGYGIIPPATGSSVPTADTAAFSSSEDPWYDAAQVEVSNGTINVTTSSSVPAQNIAVNLNNEPLGAFTADVKGEEISVASLAFNIFITNGGAGTAKVADITNVSLFDENGSVVAGPVDAANTSSSVTVSGTVTFSNSYTFPIGTNTYTLKGKIGTAFLSNSTVAASTTPSSDFGTVKGVTTGNTVTPTPSSAITMSTMTVKAGSMTVSVSSVPIAQSVVANTKGFSFANYILDATASGEDVRMTTLLLAYDKTSGNTTDLTNCQLFDGANSMTTGSNIVNPSATGSSTTYTFDGNGLIVSKGTTKTLALKCDLAGNSSGRYAWGLADNSSTYTGASGITSGQTVTETMTASQGQYMSASTGGTMTTVLDSNSPAYRLVAAGSTNVELSRIKFAAATEDVDLKEVALILTQVASNTPVDLVGRQVTLWDGATQIGTATFATSDYATSSIFATGAFKIPKDSSKVLTVKGDIAAIGVSGPLTSSGDLLAVDFDPANIPSTAGPTGTYGTGLSSGNTINPTSNYSTNSSGVRIAKAYPTMTKLTLPTNTLTAGAATDVKFYRFSVKANNGDTALYKFSFDVGSSTLFGTTSLYSLYAYTDSGYSSLDTNFSATGILNAGNCFNGLSSTAAGPRLVEIFMDKTGCNQATTTYTVSEGVTRYFELRGSTAGISSDTQTKDSITFQLAGDTAFPVNSANLMQQASGVDGDTNDDFIWSPISTTTNVLITDLDYTNGYQVEGLPSTGMSSETLQN